VPKFEGGNGKVPPEMKKKWAIETHFPEFKWIFYDFNNLTEITRIKLFQEQLFRSPMAIGWLFLEHSHQHKL
jgi:hypothetical protein